MPRLAVDLIVIISRHMEQAPPKQFVKRSGTYLAPVDAGMMHSEHEGEVQLRW